MHRAMLMLPVCVLYVLSGTAWGFGPGTHQDLTFDALNDPYVMALLTEVGLQYSASTIAMMSSDLDFPEWRETYHHPGWGTIRDRGYWYDSKWGNLDQYRRLAFICHLAEDSGMPVGNSPANDVWSNGTIEALLEVRANGWPTMPGMTYLTGDISQRINSFYNDQIALAQWSYHNVDSWWDAAVGWTGQHAMWEGLSNGLSLTQQTMVDYFLLQKPVVADAGGTYGYYVVPDGDVTFYSTGSYDPDNVVFNSDGSYYNNGQGMYFYWDFNGDGMRDFFTSNNTVTLSYDQIIGLFGPSNEWRHFLLKLEVFDNDGERAYDPLGTSYAYDTAWFHVGPTSFRDGGGAIPEPSSIALLATLAVSAGVWQFRRRRCRS